MLKKNMKKRIMERKKLGKRKKKELMKMDGKRIRGKKKGR